MGHSAPIENSCQNTSHKGIRKVIMPPPAPSPLMENSTGRTQAAPPPPPNFTRGAPMDPEGLQAPADGIYGALTGFIFTLKIAWKNYTVIREFGLLGLSSHHTVQIVLFVIFLFMYCIIIVANSLIILATTTDNKLHTPMYFFLTNLSTVDILFSSSIIPRMLKDLLAAKKTILFGECVAQMYISAIMGGTECFLLALMGFDRYMAICFPLHYTMIINRAACIRIAAGTWLSGIIIPAFHVILLWNVDFCGNNEINHFFCEVPEILALGCGDVTSVELAVSIAGIIAFILPVSFIVITYIKIVRAILNISSSVGRKKTFSTCTSHIIVVTMFYGPAVASYMKPQSKSSPDTDKLFAIFYTIVTPMLNPLVYTLRNKDVKSALKKISIWLIKLLK
ncbi:olfactory receptor 2G3-like [Gastrophryne carolinensis]